VLTPSTSTWTESGLDLGATDALARPCPHDAFASWRQHLADPRPVEVSVCIANWNCCDLLRACLRSLLHQDQGVCLEVIVVDNASSDGAADMVAHEFPEVLLVRNRDNAGFSRANNQAARRAHGRYLFFLNNDTAVPAGTLRQLVDYMHAHPDSAIVGPRLRGSDGRVQCSYRRLPSARTLLHRTWLLRWTGLLRDSYRDYRRIPMDSLEPLPVEMLMGAALLMTRERFGVIGGWDEDFTFGGEDLELCLRAAGQGKIVYFPQAEILHHGRASTRQHLEFSSPHIAVGFAKYLRKSGCTGLGMLAYKTAITLDAPGQLIAKGLQYLYRRLRGRRRDADKSLTVFKATVAFLRHGLPPFWRA